ncbi:SRPBCC family protein [Microlunatus parietis]|uniref:Carbon monoxide dehydrogenase subunit G n=1 Tax=Microlunatus parietis TaxID=682979 RepID=A0A7Y9LGK9_9ACTN|nr:SRPBCC family protein [Microlunatus parietis]NYE75316.1 carbon monoxide dehydrogenase subunit G [Microlunatus parietis]
MQLNHRFTVPVRVEDVWAAFHRLDRVAPSFPGATLESVRGDDFTGSIKIKFGALLLLYNGSGRIVDRDQAERRLVIEAKGRDRRGQGGATVELAARFVGLGRSGTEIVAETTLNLTGRPAQFGEAVISDVVDRVLERFVHDVADQLTGRTAAPAPEPVPAEPPAEPEPELVEFAEAEEQVDVEETAAVEDDFGYDELGPVAEAEAPGPAVELEPEPAANAAVIETADEAVAADGADDMVDEDDGPVDDPRGDDADFATVPLPEPPPAGAAARNDRAGQDLVRPRSGGLPAPTNAAGTIKRYAPAAAAAVAGVTALVVWALGRRRR